MGSDASLWSWGTVDEDKVVKVSDLFAGQQAYITGADVDVTGLIYDSRRVRPGALFAALVGARFDGHDHVAKAIDGGAVAVLCEKDVEVGDATLVLTPNTRLALARAAQAFFGDPAARMSMVGITGTNGKTTIVHLIEAILRAAGKKVGVIGTLGTRFAGHEQVVGLTTPESVDLVAMLAEMVNCGVQAVAMEVSSHALAQERAAGVDFNVAVFTNLTHDHLDYHGDADSYFAAKARLFRERLTTGGSAVLNLDDTRVASLVGSLPAARVIGFSLEEPATEIAAVWPRTLHLDRSGFRARLQTPIGELEISSPLLGRFNVQNVLAAVAVAVALEVESAAVAKGLAEVGQVPGRLEPVLAAGGPLVLVDYAHTPDALIKVLDAVREITDGRLICVFGCGGDRDPGKRPSMGRVVAERADWAVLTTDNPRSEDPRAIIADIEPGLAGSPHHVEVDRAVAIAVAVSQARANDVVVIAGKGHETYQIVGSQSRPFDDRAHARTALAAAGFNPGGRLRVGGADERQMVCGASGVWWQKRWQRR